ncbi:MAG: IPT/TIG domain-containing protein [Bacteroidales bacterium]|nr:IPT/TIG domain-containing protein [Bacteroidales bacterium]
MKAFRYIMAFAALALVAISCDKGPDGYEVDTKSFTVEAFGPNPVTRGGTLTFVGQQLDKTTSVILPLDVEIPSSQFIDFTSGSFKVTVPSECEEGYVTVNYSNGKSVTLSTILTYSETFELWSVSPMESGKTLLEAGDSVVLTGEYLNNVVSIGFVNGVTAGEDEIGLQERNELHFAVPKGAVSGLIYAEDSNGYQVYSTEELSILQPTVSGVSPLSVRPGDNVTIKGELLDQIVSVAFTGSSEIDTLGFVSQSYTAVVVTVPYDAQDGPLTLVSSADQEIVTDDEVTISVPGNLSVAAESVFKAGLNVIVSGDDLDLVTGVTFSGDAASESFYYSDGKLTAQIPTYAVDGAITLSCGSLKSVETPSVTLVKPVITGLDPTELTAGESFTVTGTDLDLVTGVSLNGTAVDFTTNSLTSITATTSATSTSGAVTVTAANGDSSTYGTITVNYDSRIIVTDLPSSASTGEEITMNGSGFNLIESIYFGETKVTSYTSRSDVELVFTVPSDVDSGTYNPTFVLTDGDTEICPLSITVTGAVTIREVWTGSWDLGNWNALATQPDLCWNGPFVDNPIPYGTTLTVEFTCNTNNTDGANWYQLQLCNPDGWGALDCGGGGFYQCESDTETEHTWTLTDADVDVLNSCGFLISGCYCILTRIYVSYANE